MKTLSMHKRPGRPRKIDGPDTVLNSSDASLDRIEEYSAAILAVMKRPLRPYRKSSYLKHFQQLDADKLKALAEALAYEMAFFPALFGATVAKSIGRSGPRPKIAQAIFLAQVRQVLDTHHVKIPVWKNSIGQSLALVEFCHDLALATNTKGIYISWRTVENAPHKGFTGGA